MDTTRRLAAVAAALLLVLSSCVEEAASEAPEATPEAPTPEATAPAAPAEPAFSVPDGYSSVEAAGVSFHWIVEGDLLRGILEAPTNGWIAVGFDPSRVMLDADFIFGFVKDGAVQGRDDFGNRLTAHAPDTRLGGAEDLTLGDFEETDGYTRFAFSRLLDTGDEYDTALAQGQTHKVLLAYGASDDFDRAHQRRGSVEVEL